MWHTIEFNALQIKAETDKATLIQLPNKSKLKGWGFFHPSKLVRDNGGNGYLKTFSFTDDWEFRLIRVGKKNDSITVGVDEIMDAFEHMQTETSDSYLKISEPVKIDKEVEVDEELRR